MVSAAKDAQLALAEACWEEALAAAGEECEEARAKLAHQTKLTASLKWVAGGGDDWWVGWLGVGMGRVLAAAAAA